MSEGRGPDASRAEAEPGKDHAQWDSEDDHHAEAEPGMTRIVITIEDNNRRVPQSPDDAGNDRCIDPPKGGQAGKQVSSPAELFAKGENHIEENSQGKGKNCRNQDIEQS